MPAQTKTLHIGAARIFDVRDRYPPQEGSDVARRRVLFLISGVAVHHDGAIMEPGDADYSGSTLDEDLERLDIIYRVGLDNGWGGFPYNAVASPNGRTFYTCDIALFGAHVARRNDELVGMALMGNFVHRPPGQVQLCAAGLGLVALWEWAGQLRDVRGHREWAVPDWPTACPGDTWWGWQQSLLWAATVQARIAFPRS